MAYVSDDILREILARLPVAPLFRFRCVSKQWKTLIDSGDLLKHHLDHSRKSNSHLNIIISTPIKCNLQSIDFDLLNETNRVTLQKHSLPLKSPYRGTVLLGSCDGLIALSNGGNILWNPSTRQFHKLPFTGNEFQDCRFPWRQFIVYGFGYDFVSNDYKLVRIIQFQRERNDEFECKVKVYNLKSDSWRRIPNFPYYLKYERCHGVLVNGALHWIVSREVKSDSLVAAFDLGTEECRLAMPLPEYAGGTHIMNVVVLGGCLSITCNDYVNCAVDIWVMKEYGVQESWSLLFTLNLLNDFPKIFNVFLPMAYSKCGRKVLVALDGRVFMWYDLDKKSVDLLDDLFPYPDCYQFYPCMQSLVMLSSGTRDVNIVPKEKLENQKTCESKKKKGAGKWDNFLSKWFKLAL